ncbi:MAG: hypothetical protein IKZ87_05800 [Actinomycetaceae bacterium]|nr:hypothetical protein [Actinomycetaceae bacterium]
MKVKLPAEGVLESFKAPVTDPIIAAGLPAASTGNMDAPDELGTPSLVQEANKLASGKSGRKKKITFTVDEEDAGRMRAAFMADALNGSGLTSFSAWISAHLLEVVTKKERSLNDGKPFDPVDADVIPKGRGRL